MNHLIKTLGNGEKEDLLINYLFYDKTNKNLLLTDICETFAHYIKRAVADRRVIS